MLDLASDLQERHLDEEDLWVLVQVSRTFRKLAQIPLLSRYNIPQSPDYIFSVHRQPLEPLPTQSGAFFATLDLKDQVTHLVVKADCVLPVHALLDFIHRHKSLDRLTLKSDATDSASLAAKRASDAHREQLAALSFRAVYIPGIFALTITSVTHGLELAQALSTIASDPDSKVRKLTLQFKHQSRGECECESALDKCPAHRSLRGI
ncbi:hypothetical protein B0H19DRAFT_1270485 [Mycena capillaripes]|nr:hypothetical protein B0H19DRAFT_1270485 [Mycena capillaripes]